MQDIVAVQDGIEMTEIPRGSRTKKPTSSNNRTIQPALKVAGSLIALAGVFSNETSYVAGISLRKKRCSMISVAVIASASTGIITEA